MRRAIAIIILFCITGGVLYTFDGAPGAPEPFQASDWAITTHHRDRAAWLTPPSMDAGHGADCAAPPATHLITTTAESVYQCRDHIMTAISGSAGYGAIYLQPPELVNWNSGPAVVSWDMSTQRTTTRDWVDVWITPFDEQSAAPLDSWLPDLQGPPRRALHIKMTDRTVFRAYVINDFTPTELPSRWWVPLESKIVPSATVRTPFQLTISRTHLTFGIPGILTWIDADLPSALDWDSGVVQFGHHSYTPWKDCALPNCGPNTYHWDNVSIDPAIPYSIQRVDTELITTTIPIALPAPAPDNAHLRFLSYGDGLELSFDGGGTWQMAQRQRAVKTDLGHFASYWQPLPAGAVEVRFRSLSSGWWGPWAVRALSIIGEGQ